ncbi:MAG: hypothetical protein Q8R28_06030, partial [Dehalococcoidia bacterium]|nr:hypothetical protein [Dehalococcoidia bacterium]
AGAIAGTRPRTAGWTRGLGAGQHPAPEGGTRMARDYVADQVAAAVESWWQQACRGGTRDLYLYYKPTEENGYHGGDLVVAPECPSGYTPVMMWAISGFWTREKAAHQIVKVARDLPLLPVPSKQK